MGKASFGMRMVTSTRVIGGTIKPTVTVYTNTLTEPSTSASGRMISRMALDSKRGPTAASTKESTSMVKSMAREYTNGSMEASMRVAGP